MNLLSGLKRQKVLSLTLLLFTLSIGVLIGTLIDANVNAAKEQVVAPDATPLTLPSAVQVQNEFTKLAKSMEKSVVNITTSNESRVPGRRNRPPSDEDEEEDGMDFFRRFFRSPGEEFPRGIPRREATGSGFIVDKNGYIITNNHVVERADTIRVKIPGESTPFKAKLIGTDVETDLAVIKIEPAGKTLVPARIGNSDGVDVGHWVVAIGSPFGLEATVTAGIVSATGRDVAGAQQFQHFIQTDAAINPGNSGGPLLNISGEVIGINTAIATQSGGYQGIGFALPVNTAVKVYNQIIKSGRVTRGSIGVQWSRESKPETLRALGLSNGVLVEHVWPGGPAERAGIKPEDVIIAMNGKTIKNGEDLVSQVADTPIGTEVTLTIDREGNKLDKKLTIADRAQVFQNDPRFSRNQPLEDPERAEPAQAKFGIGIRNMTDEERGTLGLEDKTRGVMVTSVVPGSFAEEIGFNDKDVIVSINRQPVTSVDDVRKVQETLKVGDAVAFRVMRADPLAGRTPAEPSERRRFRGIYLSGTLASQQ
jgi:serine protease Do